MPPSDRRYSTGLPFLDRRIGGGLHSGCLLAVTAPPHSQSELLLRQLILAQRTLYVSTTRPAAEVRRWVEAGRGSAPALSVSEQRPADLLADFSPIESRHVPESVIIVDRANGLEDASRDEYLGFLNRFKDLLQRTDSVGVLHCSDTAPNPPQRGLTLGRVDQIWQLELLSLSREIKNRLIVTKSRMGRALEEPVYLLLTDRVQVDTSRRIG